MNDCTRMNSSRTQRERQITLSRGLTTVFGSDLAGKKTGEMKPRNKRHCDIAQASRSRVICGFLIMLNERSAFSCWPVTAWTDLIVVAP